MALSGHLPRPVVRAGTGFHADQARRQAGGQLQQLGAFHCGTLQDDLPGGIDAVQCEYVLGKIDAERYDLHDFPSRVELMSVVRNPILALRCRFRALSTRPAWDGEVPFIR
jgi:hypothetical protein